MRPCRLTTIRSAQARTSWSWRVINTTPLAHSSATVLNNPSLSCGASAWSAHQNEHSGVSEQHEESRPSAGPDHEAATPAPRDRRRGETSAAAHVQARRAAPRPGSVGTTPHFRTRSARDERNSGRPCRRQARGNRLARKSRRARRSPGCRRHRPRSSRTGFWRACFCRRRSRRGAQRPRRRAH